MPCNCTGSHIFGRLQKLSSLQKLQTISKSGLSAYNGHVQNTAENANTFDSSTALYSTCSSPIDAWSAQKLHPSGRGLQSMMTAAALQHAALTHLFPVHLSAKRPHSTAATKASPAYLKTQQLFQDDRQFALEQAHSSSPRITAAQESCSSPAVSTQAAPSTQQRSSIFTTHSDSSANSMADSVSSYHGYAGVNYQMGIKDIDAVPNLWGYSLSDYKAVFGENYVHGCVPWEDQHISKQDQKRFQKLHSRRVELLQELHDIEQGIRKLMD
ncbi:TPA: hypothetical protein ACH3X3_006059 [Trebouxia sp. C0006]